MSIGIQQRLLHLSLPFLLSVTPVALATTTGANNESLEQEMESLDLKDHPPAGVSREKLYSAQQRYTPLRFVSEFAIGEGVNLSGNSFLHTQQTELSYRFHFNDRWSVGVAGATVSNEFTDAGNRLRQAEGIVPDVPFAKSRADLTVEANLFYGKFRVSTERVFYFDQYVALGGGVEDMNTGSEPAVVGDVGLVVWLGQWGSLRLGLKDYYYKETYRDGAVSENNLHAHLNLGVLL